MACDDVLQGSAYPGDTVGSVQAEVLVVEVNREGLPRLKQVQTEVHQSLVWQYIGNVVEKVGMGVIIFKLEIVAGEALQQDFITFFGNNQLQDLIGGQTQLIAAERRSCSSCFNGV